MINPEAYYSSEKGVTVYPVQMHNASQGSFNPNTRVDLYSINPSSTISFTAAETFAPTPGAQNLGLAGRGATTAPLATPPPYGPIRRGADGNPIRGGILTAWGSGHSEGALVRPGRRPNRRRNAVDGIEPRFSDGRLKGSCVRTVRTKGKNFSMRLSARPVALVRR